MSLFQDRLFCCRMGFDTLGTLISTRRLLRLLSMLHVRGSSPSKFHRGERLLSPQSYALVAGRYISLGVIVICAAILLVGYSAGYQRLYQPWEGGSSTHPFTALALAFIAL